MRSTDGWVYGDTGDTLGTQWGRPDCGERRRNIVLNAEQRDESNSQKQ